MLTSASPAARHGSRCSCRKPRPTSAGLFMPRRCWRNCWDKAGHSTAAPCAPRWRPHSAAPMPKGRVWKTPTSARRRRSCSCANSAARSDARAGSAAAMLEMLTRSPRFPSQTRRSEESEIPAILDAVALGFVAAEAAALTPGDLVLEPSAGPGCWRRFAELAKARLALDPRSGPAPVARPAPAPRPATTRSRSTTISRWTTAERLRRSNPSFYEASPSSRAGARHAEAAIRHIASAIWRAHRGRTARRDHRAQYRP